MSNSQKKLLKYKPYKSNFQLSLISEFLQRIQIQEKNCGWVAGGWGVRDWSQEDGGGEKQNCKITNMTHHRINVYNI